MPDSQTRLDELDDYGLLVRWQSGDTRASNTLIRRHFDDIWRFFINRVGDGDAEDLTQETLTRLVQSAPAFRGDSSFRTYLFSIARRVRVDYYRHKSCRPDFDPKTHSVADVGCSPSHLVTTVEKLDLLLTCVRQLPVETMLLLELYYWHDMTAKQLAQQAGVTEKTIRGRLERARASLRRCLAEAPGHAKREDAPESLELLLSKLGQFVIHGQIDDVAADEEVDN